MVIKDKPHLFCFGLGYVGLRLAVHLQGLGWRVSGTVRDADQVAALHQQGIEACVFDGPLDLSGVSHVLSTIPPVSKGDPVCQRITDCPSVGWVGYLSTTGVYGNTGGIVVDETARLKPSSSRAEARVEAENTWQELQATKGFAVHVFRLPGIYGPTRSVFDQYQANRLRRIEKPGHLFNRIHVDDIVQALHASMDKHQRIKQTDNANAAIYNVADNLACEPSVIASYACELMGVEPPPLVAFDEAAATMSAMALSFWQDNRRVSNHKMKSDLGVKLRYPDYRRGLEAIWQDMV